MNDRLAKKQLGAFEITSGKITITDPCYEPGAWCSGQLEHVLNGTWHANVFISDEGVWGDRVAYLLAYHAESANYVHLDTYLWQDTGFQIGVDSGQAGIFDTSVIRNDKGTAAWDAWYDAIIELTNPASVLEGGSVSSTGYGDGLYSCYVIKDNQDQVIAVKLDFSVVADEDEDWDEDTENWDEEEYLDEEEV